MRFPLSTLAGELKGGLSVGIHLVTTSVPRCGQGRLSFSNSSKFPPLFYSLFTLGAGSGFPFIQHGVWIGYYYGRWAWRIWSPALWAANTPHQRPKDGVSWFDVFFNVFARHSEDMRQRGSKLSRETGTFTSKAIGEWSVERKRCIVPGSMAWIYPKERTRYPKAKEKRVDSSRSDNILPKAKPNENEKKTRKEKKKKRQWTSRIVVFVRARATHFMGHKKGGLKGG
ncbi:uncharacterized protein LY79DRAFT_397226 [Colletotrichum navitas]|uniref:Uncharacterized protein n=1 Tax=Colletotrichum navitas TaxID=681940 RepID=A0AAD8PQ05_9PEZI|nr:uncharacterized protein LY79DRAFT_397226 [Colletotrichum navitas]KAK1573801.1 hypothetical protein LY79DRAFT_397226 [Colletotrichum navitas]